MLLSDEARSIFVFAAYHQLASAEAVRDVVLEDGAGHRADPSGVDELKSAGLLEIEGDRGRFTDEGAEVLKRFVEAARQIG